MIVKRLKIQNFKSIRCLEITCNDKMNVIEGVNGAGKSSVLQALELLFSWMIARMRNASGKGIGISTQDINIDADFCLLEVELTNGISWSLFKQKNSNRLEVKGKTDLVELSKYVNNLLIDYGKDATHTELPLVASYSVNRSVIEIPVRIRKKQELDPMAIYNISLTGGVNFRTFFEWFREREDIENEKARFEKYLT